MQQTGSKKQTNTLFDLLLWSQLVCVPTLLLAAVGGTGVQPGIAPADGNPTRCPKPGQHLEVWTA